jgi:hypothetical protein
MTLEAAEFIRRFLLHVLPRASTASAIMGCLPARTPRPTSRARELLAAPQSKVECGGSDSADAAAPTDWRPPCPCCGGRMIIIETFERSGNARAPPSGSSTSGARAS